MGKGGDRVTEDSKEKTAVKEVLLNGVYYDISNLKHPGGSVIDFYAAKGIDATQAFENFHYRSAKAKKYLSALPQRPADAKKLSEKALPGQEALLKDFEELTNQFIAEGKFKPSLSHVVYRVSEIVLLHVVGLYLMVNTSHLALGLVLLAIGQGRCGWLMHEGGHHSLTGVIKVDIFLQQVIYGIGCGMSGGWWRIQHNKHHSMPQKVGHDVDLNTLPLVAFTTKVVSKRHGSIQRGWLFLQAYLFPIITTLLVALGWQCYLHPRHIIRSKNVVEGLALAVRYVGWTLLITSKFGLAKSTLLYLAYVWLGANYIFINFALSHTHLDTVEKDDTQVDWVRYAAIYTMNVKSGPFKIVDWWMSYLNYQVEHHLYPSMPQYRHPSISPRVKALFEKHGLEYKSMDYISAMGVTFENLHKVGTSAFYG